ncbi:MAG TPA: phosphoribosyltransferase [Crinalium sp.]|jgi:adenine/guanine phosphoribosyltransferase-like PRPP-binding protein
MKRTHYTVRIIASDRFPTPPPPPFQDSYPVRLTDGNYLELPLQPFPDGKQAIALLMSNQTPFAVEQALTPLLADAARAFEPEAIAGIPTLGLDYARVVAKNLGLPDYVALGTSRKFWYDDTLSVPVVSVTSPDAKKSLYLDPSLLERVAGKRTLIVDDVINTGGTAIAAIQLLQTAGTIVVGLVVVLTEGHDWKEPLSQIAPELVQQVRGLGHIPIFEQVDGGWAPILATQF